jgi:hypothetical protein
VGHGGALVALDRGSEAAGAADNGEQWLRRRFGKELRSGEEVAVNGEPLHGLSRSGSSYWACLKAERGTTRANWSWQRRRKVGQLGRRRRDVGEAGAGQRGVGKAATRQGRARGSAQSGSGAAVRGTWPARATAMCRAEKKRRPGLEEEDED